jgi:hypothetical protein
MSYKSDLNKIKIQIQQNLSKYSAAALKDAGPTARDLIYKRTKSGYGVDSDTTDKANKKRLEKLSPNYIAQRRKYPGAGEFFSAGRSNLTRTGQLLNAIDFKVSNGKLELFIKDSSRSDGNISNKEVAEYVRAKRPFFNLTVQEQRVLLKQIENSLRTFIRLAFNQGGR